MYVRAFAVTPGLKHFFTRRQLEILGTAVGDDATVELTTAQQFLVQMDADRAGQVRKTLHTAGMKTYEVGPVVKNVRACNFCQGDDEEGYAYALALDESVAGMAVPFPLRVAYSGCQSGCSEPVVHDIGVIKNGAGFDIYVGGCAIGLSPRPGTLVAQGIAPGEMAGAVRRIIQFYMTDGHGRERFWKFADRVGAEALSKSIVRFVRVYRNRTTGARIG